MKFDPYLNIDPGPMSPLQHGEVYVTDDGAETDLDLGHYERFTKSIMKRSNSVSAGQIYDSVISKERRGDYLGGTVQVIPHITDEIKRRVFEVSKKLSKKKLITIVEIGGTVGDIEAQPFFEAIRQLRLELGEGNTALVHVTYVPYIAVAGELKSKPTQHSVKELREIGLQPDFLICRSEKDIDESLKAKIGLFCSIDKTHVISAKDSSSIYEVPLALHKENLDALIVKKLKLKSNKPNLQGWKKVVSIQKNPKFETTIAVVGKYVDLKESYKSLHEALVHAGIANNTKLNINYVDSENINKKNVKKTLRKANGVLVPGGFGSRGVEGKILAIQYARENKIPFLGICLGMQLAIIEFARNVCGWSQADSTEWTPGTRTPIIDIMESQKDLHKLGGTMRLGNYRCLLKKGSLAESVYQSNEILERHRHRYELNNEYRNPLISKGLVICGTSPDDRLVEMIELNDHPYFIATQAHPEFKSRPLRPHPLFDGLIKAAGKIR